MSWVERTVSSLSLFLLPLLLPLLLMLLPHLTSAENTLPPVKLDPFADLEKMNGIRLSDFSNFFTKWKLVTVRYREDTHEQRFTFANAQAQKVLGSGQTDFPDGAVFAKISYFTHSDPLFPSSVAPFEKKRIQFMVHDARRYAATQGWGYALFNGEGRTLNGEPKQVAQACAACHQIAQSRGYVFSQPMGSTPSSEAKLPPIQSFSGLKFESVPRSSLPEPMERNIVTHNKHIYVLKGAIQESSFEGTANEILPTLIEKAKATKIPAALISSDGRLFSAAYIDESPLACDKSRIKVKTVRTLFDSADPHNTILKLSQSCLEKSH